MKSTKSLATLTSMEAILSTNTIGNDHYYDIKVD